MWAFRVSFYGIKDYEVALQRSRITIRCPVRDLEIVSEVEDECVLARTKRMKPSPTMKTIELDVQIAPRVVWFCHVTGKETLSEVSRLKLSDQL